MQRMTVAGGFWFLFGAFFCRGSCEDLVTVFFSLAYIGSSPPSPSSIFLDKQFFRGLGVYGDCSFGISTSLRKRMRRKFMIPAISYSQCLTITFTIYNSCPGYGMRPQYSIQLQAPSIPLRMHSADSSPGIRNSSVL